MATIVQDYGPIYGEVVNGTVQGRPNGSVYVPISNTINISISAATSAYIRTDGSPPFYRICQSNGNIKASRDFIHAVAESQDLASNMLIELYDDEALTNKIGYTSFAAGIFNGNKAAFTVVSTTEESTVYAVGYLVNNNTKVATSSVLALSVVTI